VVIVDVELSILRNDGMAGKGIGGEPFVLPAELCTVEDPPDVVPAKGADQPLFAITEFLAADLERQGKFLVIAQGDKGLVEVYTVSFGTVSLFPDGTWDVWDIRISEAFVAGFEAAATFEIGAPPFLRVTDMEAEFGHPVGVIRIGAIGSEIIVGFRGRTAEAGDAVTLVIFETHAFGAAEVPGAEIRVLLAQPFVEVAGEGLR